MRQFKSDMLNSMNLAWYQSTPLNTPTGTNQHGYAQQMFWRRLKRNKKMWQRKAQVIAHFFFNHQSSTRSQGKQ